MKEIAYFITRCTVDIVVIGTFCMMVIAWAAILARPL